MFYQDHLIEIIPLMVVWAVFLMKLYLYPELLEDLLRNNYCLYHLLP